jgi:sugar-specific transcriptional regulator TrmB
LEFQEAEVQTLVDLGLTSMQAKIYFNLAKSGPSSVAAIAKQSKVNMPHVYQTVTKLHDLGLVERIVTAPALFKAASADQTLKLLRRKNGLQDNLEVNVKPLIDTGVNKKQAHLADKFVLIPQNDAVLERVGQAIKKTKFSMDFIVSWRFFKAYALGSYPVRPVGDSVNCRCILEQSSSEWDHELLGLVRQTKNCKFKFTPNRLSALLAIFDRKEIVVIEDSPSNLNKNPALWTNNENLVTISQNYFDSLWLKTKNEPALSR